MFVWVGGNRPMMEKRYISGGIRGLFHRELHVV